MFNRQRIGEILINNQIITKEQLELAIQQQVKSGIRLGDILLANGWVKTEDLDKAQAIQYEVPYEPLTIQISRDILDLIPANIAQECKVIPISFDDKFLHLAMHNPNDLGSIDWIQSITHKTVAPRFTPIEKIERALTFYYGIESDDTFEDQIETNAAPDRFSLEEVKRASEEPPVVALVNSIISDAARRNASDIHVEPGSTSFDIRYRVDGMLIKVKTLPKSIQNAVISRIKVMSDLDISERRLPQDGRIGVKISDRHIDLRVSSFPIRHGERIVMRILDQSKKVLNLNELGFSEHNYNLIQNVINRPHGILLVTGPTGSGKTTTLYAILSSLKNVKRNILTCEDPIEYEMDGIGQSQVNDRIGLTFAAQLRSTLRQDPDIILVGEIRDPETAETACRAAMTGHLVLSTLHTNDAPGVIPRLIDLGVEPFLLNSSLTGIIAQRLVRSLCVKCRYEEKATDDEINTYKLANNATVWRAGKCDICDNTGYKGRFGIHEFILITEEMRELISNKPQSSVIRYSAIKDGMKPLHQDAINKALTGKTSLEEIKPFVIADPTFKCISISDDNLETA